MTKKRKRQANEQSLPREKDLQNLTMSLKDEAEETKALLHPKKR